LLKAFRDEPMIVPCEEAIKSLKSLRRIIENELTTRTGKLDDY
jgi:hypothetical protein